jgi:uncharacterized membrane protein YedE/YeeE
MLESLMENFTPISALIGGALIGLAVVWLLTLNGRIAGISGILGGILRPVCPDRSWRLAFLLGLVVGPMVLSGVAPGSFAMPEIRIETPVPLLVLAGILVGYGSRLGSGCTSGHGICGLARFSRRSLVATGVFMGMGVTTVLVLRPVLFAVLGF